MDNEYILSVAQTIKDQLFATTDINVFCSWGADGFMATRFNEKPALIFHVEGRLFSGAVIIAYNASDLYEVHLVNQDTERCLSDEVYVDQLSQLIDEAVERGTDPEEYSRFCASQIPLLFTSQV